MPKIAIIEDNANLSAGLQAKFSLLNFTCRTFNGNKTIAETLHELRQEKPDYFILDLMLPKIDGFELIKAIRQDEFLKNAKIFIFTNLSDQDSKDRSEKLGADYYFVKSDYVIDEFIEKIYRIIKNQSKL